MTRFLVINAYSARNIGDAAIMVATAELLRRLRPGCEVTIAARHYAEDRAFYAQYGIEVAPPLVPFPPAGGMHNLERAARLGLGLLLVVLALLFARCDARAGSWCARRLGLAGLHEAMTADAVVLAGGGYLYSARRRLNLTLLHAIVSNLIAAFLRKPVVMMPQSIGPLTRTWDRCLVRWGLSAADPIVAREGTSRDEALEVVGSRRAILVCPDIAFVTRPPSIAARPRASKPSMRRRRVGIVLMDWRWARASGDFDAYLEKMTTVVCRLVALGHEVVLTGHSRMPEQGQDDFEVVRRVLDATRGGRTGGAAVSLAVPAGLEELKQLFAGLDVVIGTRLHSCILAMTSGTPAIALAYQPKATGTYGLLGLGELCLDVERFEVADLVRQVCAVLDTSVGYEEAVRLGVGRARDQIEAVYAARLNQLA